MQMDPGSRLQGTGDAFVVDKVQGEGGFGITYRCHRERDGLPVIAKVLRVERLGEWKSLELFEREAQVLRQLVHDRIPDYVDFFSQGDPAAPAGLVLVQSPNFHFRLEYMLKASTPTVVLTRRFRGEDSVIASVPLDAKRLYLKVEAKAQAYSFFYAVADEQWRVLQENVDGRTLSRTNAGGFVGTMIGPYASSNGTRSSRYAEFDWFEYKGETE